MASQAKPSQGDPGKAKSNHKFPSRPANGGKMFSTGPYNLLANYFAITLEKDVAWKRYYVQVQHITDKEDVPKGFKLQQIIKKAIHSLGIEEDKYASDFKSQLLVLESSPPNKKEVIEHFTNDQGRTKPYRVELVGYTDISFNDLKKFVAQKALSDMEDNPYTCFTDVLDACGIVLGHKTRSDSGVNSLRSGNFFRFEPELPYHRENLSPLLTLIRGYFQSVRPASGPPLSPFLLNTNVAYGVFRQPVGLSQVFRPRNHFGSHDEYLEHLIDINNQLAKAKIVYSAPVQNSDSVNQRNKVMLGLADLHRSTKGIVGAHPPRFSQNSRFGGPKQVTFFLNGGGNMSYKLKDWYNKHKSDPYITVYDYFNLQFGKSLKGNLPLIDIGTPQKPIFVPAELCKIKPGQLVASKLDTAGSKIMIDFACKSPRENQKFIKDFGRQVLQLDNNKTLEHFGLKIAESLKQVTGRLLRPPKVQYRAQKESLEQAGGGGWYRPSRKRDVGKVLKSSNELIEWTYVHFYESKPSFDVTQTLLNALKQFGTHLQQDMGLNMKPSPEGNIPVTGSSEQEQAKTLGKMLGNPPKGKSLPKYLIVVLPKASIALYQAIKLMGDIQYGIHTVCITKEKLFKPIGKGNERQLNIWDGLGFKLNLKAGGVNHQLTGEHVPQLIQKGESMFVGYDVSHPTNFNSDDAELSNPQDPKGKGKATATEIDTKIERLRIHDRHLPPSQIALVASMDKELGQWPVVTWTNPGKKEMLGKELYGHFLSRLRLYRDRNKNKLPESVVIYRDGVSEGQYKQVTNFELPHIKRACNDACEKYNKKGPIAVTLVVAVKRHQTRFYPGDDKTPTDKTRNNNTKAGTVVDNSVTVQSHWDFYLQSHAAIKGTARPAHYTVLHDEVFRVQYKDKSADQLEQVTHCISYAFGRATKAVSLCTPAYYADMACTRARLHMWELYETQTQGGDTDEVRKRRVHKNLENSMYYI